MIDLSYLQGYSPDTLAQVRTLVEQGKLAEYLLKRYPEAHQVRSARALYDYTMELKNTYMRRVGALSSVVYTDKIDAVRNALGVHSFISRVQGSKLKAKNEIQIASIFRKTPEAFLRMILVHELAHFREKDHNKAFYQLCEYMEPEYHQLEFDLRLYLTHLLTEPPLYQ